jgi:hypothetical protein
VLGFGFPVGFPVVVANAFTSGANFYLTQVDVGAGWVLGDNGIALSLNADNGGQPGSVIESWNLTDLPVLGTCCVVTCASDMIGAVLQAGAQYWLVMAAIDSTSWDGWKLTALAPLAQSVRTRAVLGG